MKRRRSVGLGLVLALSLSGCHSLIGRGGGLLGVEPGPLPGLRTATKSLMVNEVTERELNPMVPLLLLLLFAPDLALSTAVDFALLPLDILIDVSGGAQERAERRFREESARERSRELAAR